MRRVSVPGFCVCGLLCLPLLVVVGCGWDPDPSSALPDAPAQVVASESAIKSPAPRTSKRAPSPIGPTSAY